MADLTKLQNSLLKAKKVMGAVESGNPIQSSQNRTMNETMTQQVPPEQLLSQLPSNQSNSLMAQAQQERPMNMNPKASLTKDRIMESKLPDAIKKAMISNPIPTMDFNNATNKLSPEFIEEVSKKMKSQDYSVDGMRWWNKVRNILEETSINENLSLRVGNKIFFGKINKVKSVKK